MKNTLFKIYKKIFKLTGIVIPKNKKIIIFESFLGKQYSDNPRAIYEYLHNYYPNYKLIWSVDRKSTPMFKKLKVKHAQRFSIKWMYLMNRSKYWISNSRMPLWIPKPSKTVYLQTWHGTPLKKLAIDMENVLMPGTNTEKYKHNFVAESSKWDYLVSPNQFSTEIFKRAFQFHKKIIESGYPRNDYLVNNQSNKDEIDRIKSELNLPNDKKIILYAPTWRDNQSYGIGRYKFDIPINFKKMKDSLSDNYIIVLRMHYLIAEQIDLEGINDFVYDTSLHKDINELYLISDILITDYSSVFFDYAILNRPIYFYTADLEEYRDTLRGFYLNYEKEAPGPITQTTTELIKEIKSVNNYDYNRLAKFNKHFNYLEDGNATERVVHTFLNKANLQSNPQKA